MSHSLPELPWSGDALAPHISAETLEFHHGKHHRTYVDKLNGLIAGTEFESMALEDIVKKSSGGVFNNAGQHFNHSFYWNSLAPDGGGDPEGALKEALERSFGSVQDFREKFSAQATTLFGSGWCWLVKNADGSLAIEQTQNADTPITEGKTPLLTCDVWEHAYYIDYRNARPKYLEAWWSLVNWKHAAACFGA